MKYLYFSVVKVSFYNAKNMLDSFEKMKIVQWLK